VHSLTIIVTIRRAKPGAIAMRRALFRVSRRIGALAFLACGATALAGCGQSGPLYLPKQHGQPPAQQAAPAKTAPAPAGATR